MKNDTKMEAYLAQLEKALGPVTVSEKAEIIMEIKSHILAALERDPGTNVDKIFASLGSPEQVANRYLLERGLKPVVPPRSNVWKWLGIGMIGSVAVFFLFVIVVMIKFTPLLKVDEENGRVTLLGGAIDIDEMGGTVHIGSSVLTGNMGAASYQGQKKLTAQESINVDFSNGKFEIQTSDNGLLKWDCRTRNQKDDSFFVESDRNILFDFEQAASVKCEIDVPSGLKLEVSGPNGKVKLVKPEFETLVKVTNGNVSIEPAAGKKYRYDLSVVNGVIEDFKSSPDPDAIPIKISLVNGKIDRDEENEADEE